VAAEIEAGGGEALVLPADVTSEDEVAAAVERAASTWGGLDVIVANAGVQLAGQDDRADRLALAVWRRTIDINLTGVFLTCKHGIRALGATAAARSSAPARRPASTASHPATTPTARARPACTGSSASWRPTTRRRASG
jgi:NAD(P)-dependent dehydrogenase (short-subunit alcohol dehydrogenase family)